MKIIGSVPTKLVRASTQRLNVKLLAGLECLGARKVVVEFVAFVQAERLRHFRGRFAPVALYTLGEPMLYGRFIAVVSGGVQRFQQGV